MIRFTPYPEERSALHAQVAVQLRDEFTGQQPQGRIDVCVLEAETEREVDVRPRVSSMGIWSFPGLGNYVSRETEFSVRIDCEYYDSLEVKKFTVIPYRNDEGLSVGHDPGFRTIRLRPNQKYPYPTHVPTIRGRVWDSNDVPAVGVSVDYGIAEFTKTDEDGFFALPIRWLAAGVWPTSEIALATASKSDPSGRHGILVVSATVGLTKWARLELVETNRRFHLTDNVQDGDFEVAVDLPAGVDMEGDPDLNFEESFLAPQKRRYRIDSAQSSTTTLLLDRPLHRSLPRGTQFSLRTQVAVSPGEPPEEMRLIEIEKVNRIAHEVTLAKPLRRRWSAGTRVLRYPSHKPDARVPLELDLNDPRPHEEKRQGQHQALVAVPDHFRFMEIQLPS